MSAIRFGAWLIATRWEKNGLVACCAKCGTELPFNFVKANELDYLYCSELCLKDALKNYSDSQKELESLI